MVTGKFWQAGGHTIRWRHLSMLIPDAALPDDLDALKVLVAHLTEQVTGQARTIELQDR